MNFKDYLTESKIYVDTTNYRTIHKKSPSAKGLWFFFFSKDENEKPIQISGTYTEAVKKAKEMAKVKGHSIIYVKG